MMLDPIGRDEAREMARRELEKQVYQRDKPSWLERAWDDFTEWLRELTSGAPDPQGQGDGGGWLSIAIMVVIALIAVALIVWLMRGRRNPRSRKDPLLEDEPSRAVDHRDAAERYAEAGQWAEAIRERLRAMARDLEERAVLAARPGRTADELAAEAGEAVPDLAEDLSAGVRIFDDVWYGDRPGTPEGYARMTELDERLRAARPKPLEADDLALAGADDEGGPRW
ncbi:DUF4129 domain-containing protein [Actinomadura madurae]|nr:DUF4129 domain-containing protein [Actinomadura madurae]MCP9950522.1 DUF4129 domain-containing protein [Actinomadura madurae]MCP9967304.1 DUF4129 domain-containing protein [Actinomadura madurae]MCP9979760.1 DUF4129 domain-containing protein [Actinomadura madurae]MCQ0008708.1 DUF4129 domain-containing protein [Actinomadura madurae]MCQ0015968.1 DUF4129 domain-containing protein [Actinomadura madurae]